MGVAWTVAETGRLLASVDYCVAKGLEYRKDLAALMAVKEFERTPNHIRASGSQSLNLPNELKQAVDRSARDIRREKNLPASPVGKKRLRAGTPEEEPTAKRSKTARTSSAERHASSGRPVLPQPQVQQAEAEHEQHSRQDVSIQTSPTVRDTSRGSNNLLEPPTTTASPQEPGPDHAAKLMEMEARHAEMAQQLEILQKEKDDTEKRCAKAEDKVSSLEMEVSRLQAIIQQLTQEGLKRKEDTLPEAVQEASAEETPAGQIASEAPAKEVPAEDAPSEEVVAEKATPNESKGKGRMSDTMDDHQNADDSLYSLFNSPGTGSVTNAQTFTPRAGGSENVGSNQDNSTLPPPTTPASSEFNRTLTLDEAGVNAGDNVGPTSPEKPMKSPAGDANRSLETPSQGHSSPNSPADVTPAVANASAHANTNESGSPGKASPSRAVDENSGANSGDTPVVNAPTALPPKSVRKTGAQYFREQRERHERLRAQLRAQAQAESPLARRQNAARNVDEDGDVDMADDSVA